MPTLVSVHHLHYLRNYSQPALLKSQPIQGTTMPHRGIALLPSCGAANLPIEPVCTHAHKHVHTGLWLKKLLLVVLLGIVMAYVVMAYIAMACTHVHTLLYLKTHLVVVLLGVVVAYILVAYAYITMQGITI